MHPAYFETLFHLPRPVARWPDELVILSAWATTGETWTERKNRAADRTQTDDADRHCLCHVPSPGTVGRRPTSSPNPAP